MEFNIPIGDIFRMEMTVDRKDTAAHYGSGLIEVFATPAMIGLMEGTAQVGIQKYLPEGYITLGIEINVKHLKATPVGMKVYCESTVTGIEDKKIMFELLKRLLRKKAPNEYWCFVRHLRQIAWKQP